jgi:hypothetical protein
MNAWRSVLPASSKAIDVIDILSDLFILHGIPAHIRSDNGPEFVAKAVQEWIAAVGAKTAYIERGSPWEARAASAQRRSSNANSLCGQNSAGFPQICATFKGIIYDDISEFESYMPRQAVGSLAASSGLQKYVRMTHLLTGLPENFCHLVRHDAA